MLDFDGVLNSKQHFLALKEQGKPLGKDTLEEADLECMKRLTNSNNFWCLKYILANVPDLKIVISSAWRNHFKLEQFKELFKHYGLDGERIIDKTPKRFSSERVHEIHEWLDVYYELKREKISWAAIDDHVIFNLEDSDKANEFLTDSWVGLTMNDAFKIIKYFKSDFKEPEIAI